ncbi:hypothetical protein ACLB1Q_23405 [Escherichia coli]
MPSWNRWRNGIQTPGREGAAKIWYGQIKDMPVSDASVQALKKYL